MLDPILSLAVSVHGSPGVYALLLGSGLSSSAGIPTGWGIILDLIQRIAALQGEAIEQSDAEIWYREKFEKPPEYGQLLDALAKSQTERQQLLRKYIEPTPEEREEGTKVPTDAHRAIAELVANGSVRVIVTTNFDHLLENALRDQGITPTVVASADAVHGALPLAHSPCTIVKLHGDYMDTRILNTAGELESYPPELNRLLDQVLDEYGLIVCGWSAEWDTALRAAIERTSGHRFTTFWAAYGTPTPAARNLIQLRRAVEVSIEGADPFFRDVTEKVISLEELSRPNPLTTAVAVQTLKRYLPDPLHHIRLHDLVMEEVDRVLGATSLERFPVTGVPVSVETLAARVRAFDAATNTLAALFAAGSFHGRGDHDTLWIAGLERLARPGMRAMGGNVASLHLRAYPGLLAMYAAGLGAVAAEEYGTLAHVLTGGRVTEPYKDKNIPLVLAFIPHEILDKAIVGVLRGGVQEYTWCSGYLHAVFAERLRPYVGSDERYDEVFNRFEYLTFLVHGDERSRELPQWGPAGRFAWNSRGIRSAIDEEIAAQGEDWPLLRHGLFGGDLGRLKETKEKMDQFLDRVGATWF